MESLTYMILGLPHALGGYGLGDAVLTIRWSSKKKDRHVSGKTTAAWICFTNRQNWRLYESFAHHQSLLKLEGAIQVIILQRRGIDVMHMSTIQLYDKEACRDFAYALANRIESVYKYVRRISIRCTIS